MLNCGRRERAKTHVPVLERAEFDGAVWCGSDGIVDIHALLSGYLKSAIHRGARIHYGKTVRALRALKGRETEVVTDGDRYQAKVVVNASGAWANRIASMAGAAVVAVTALPPPSVRVRAAFLGG